MTSSNDTAPPAQLWVIEHSQTKRWLGINDRSENAEPKFGARIPLTYRSRRAALDAWQRHCKTEGYIKRRIVVAGQKKGYDAGPNHRACPAVRIKCVKLEPHKFQFVSAKEMVGDD